VFGDSAEVPGSFSSDGKTLFYSQQATKSEGVWTLDLETGKSERVLAQRVYGVRASPDSRWLAVAAVESGAVQITIRPYPDVSSGQWNVGPPGAGLPRWSADGRELFYITRDRISTVTVASVPAPTIGTPQLLVPSSVQVSWYDVAPDGKRFLFLQRDSAPGVQDVPNVIVNWFEELKAVP
jgi:Tol biopolymer transport system component